MSVLRQAPRQGDWVKATAAIKVTLTDHLVATPSISRGTLGVVVEELGGWLRPAVRVRFDTGLGGSRDATVPTACVRVTRRSGGVDRFAGRTRVLGLLRLGTALALLGPLVYFAAAYFWTFGSVDGLVPALVSAAIDSAMDTALFALDRPIEAGIFLVLAWLLGRFAFR
ncbi:MAG: hypothetical protein V7697_28905 [Rhodococcus erythropolis]